MVGMKVSRVKYVDASMVYSHGFGECLLGTAVGLVVLLELGF